MRRPLDPGARAFLLRYLRIETGITVIDKPEAFDAMVRYPR